MFKGFTLILILSIYVNGADFIQETNSVIDVKHKLQWQDTKAIQGLNEIYKMSRGYCESLKLDGYDDWRLPTVKELLVLANSKELQQSFIYLEKKVFWSVEDDKDDDVNSICVYSGNGHISSNDKCDSNYAICVRSR